MKHERIWVERMPVEPPQVPAFEFRASKANWYGRGTEYVHIDEYNRVVKALEQATNVWDNTRPRPELDAWLKERDEKEV